MRFRREYEFLSNFYPCRITMMMPDGKEHSFINAEAAFQAHKSSDTDVISQFENIRGVTAKRLGKQIEITEGIENWNKERVNVMRSVVSTKFKQNPELFSKLQSINERIVEENSWHDTFWGVCDGVGENNLGKILEHIKSEVI